MGREGVGSEKWEGMGERRARSYPHSHEISLKRALVCSVRAVTSPVGTAEESDEPGGTPADGAAPPAPDVSPLTDPHAPDESRRDEAVTTRGFKHWCREQHGLGNPQELEWIDRFWKCGVRWPNNYDVDAYLERAEAAFPDMAEEVMAALMKAEARWRADLAVSHSTAAHAGISPHGLANKLDFHQGQADDRCGFHSRDGRRCKYHVVPGSNRCVEHGGALVDADTRRAVLMSSYLQLVHHASTAVECLVDVAQHSKNDQARVMAAKEILDRAGLTPDLNINVNVSGASASPASKLQARLDEIAERLGRSGIQLDDDDIIDAEEVPPSSEHSPEGSESEGLGPEPQPEPEPEPEPAST